MFGQMFGGGSGNDMYATGSTPAQGNSPWSQLQSGPLGQMLSQSPFFQALSGIGGAFGQMFSGAGQWGAGGTGRDLFGGQGSGQSGQAWSSGGGGVDLYGSPGTPPAQTPQPASPPARTWMRGSDFQNFYSGRG